MMSLAAAVEIQVFTSVEKAETFRLIVHAVGMNDIHHHCDTSPVRIVHQMLELFRSPEPGGQCIEIGYLIAERPVVRMLLQGHYLQRVIAQFLHVRKDIGTELLERSHLLILGAHSDMTFIYKRMRPRSRSLMFPLIWLFRLPDLCAEHLGHRVLHHTVHVGRQPLTSAARPLDEEFVQFSVMEEHARNLYLPVSSARRGQCIGRRAFPVVEFTDEIDPVGIRSPFPEHPASVSIPVKAVIKMIVQAFGQ